MHTSLAGRMLLCGATLLASTALAEPAPCLPQHPSPPTQQPEQKPPQQQQRWYNPCHLEDAEKAGENENDGEHRKTAQELLDEIEMLSKLGLTQDEPQLLWIAPSAHGEDEAGAPGTASHFGQIHYARPLDLADSGDTHFEGEIPAVPEPASAALLLAGLGVLAAAATRQRRRHDNSKA
ncbi:PEP-CTERM sorting domain-containing protein [Duganella flavida]|nr:PEP-CTERM sorting domain-containing protein [Duganella flavida]